MPNKEESKKSIQDLMKYLKQREKKFGKKSGYSTDLNINMLSFLHVIGQRKFNGVTLDDKGNMISDEVNPSFFHQYMSGDDESSEEKILRLPTRPSHEENPDEPSASTGRILKFPTKRKRIKETNMREEFYDEHDITGDDLSFGDIELEEIEHDGKTYFGVFSATLTCIGNKISNFNYKLKKLYDKEDDEEVSENSPIFKEIEKSSKNDVLTCAVEEMRDMDMQHRDNALDESSNDDKECPKCNGTGRISNDSYNEYVGDARARRFFKESNGGLMRNYCLKTDLTISWGWGNMHEAHFAAGTPCKASNQPKNKFWIDGEPTSFTGNDLDFYSWMETYGFLVDRDEVEPCTESNTNYNDLNDILSNASTYEEEAEDFLNDRNIPYNTHNATALIRMAWNHGWRPETKNLNEASFHKDDVSNQIEVDGFEYQGRIFNCVAECDHGSVESDFEGDPSVHGGVHKIGGSSEDMQCKLLELSEVIGDDVIEIQQTDPIFKEVEAALDEELWNHYN